MPDIAIIDGGTYYHHRALYGDRYRNYFSKIIYIRELKCAALDRFDAIVVPDRTHPGPLRASQVQFERFLAQGKTLIVFGENQAHTWLPNITWCERPTNFWWWKIPGASLGLYAAAPDHALFQHLSPKEATWHYHGIFIPPKGASTLIGLEGDGAILYEDMVSTPGNMVISSLDPFYHYGSYFIPVTEHFLYGFFEWLTRACGPEK